jgi:phenylpropionate dioxygenase-like ring-hydroxylating dioxygenase large terminal subunit
MTFGEGSALDTWRLAALSPELKPGRMESREYLGQPVLIGRTKAGAVFALRDACPHRGARLSAGKLRAEPGGGQSVECPYHAWRFRTDGVCAGIPALTADNPLDVSKVRVRKYPLVETQGLVWIWMSSDPRFDGQPPFPPPVVPGGDGDADQRGRWYHQLKREWNASRRERRPFRSPAG